MSKFHIIAGLIVALIAFVVIKLLGMLIEFALFAAVLGFVAGLLIAWLMRRGR